MISHSKCNAYYSTFTNSFKVITALSIKSHINVQKRSMQSSRGFIGQQGTSLLKRHSYPPMPLRAYKAVNYIEPNNLRTNKNEELTKHEITCHGYLR
jgi:hypothetical protein